MRLLHQPPIAMSGSLKQWVNITKLMDILDEAQHMKEKQVILQTKF